MPAGTAPPVRPFRPSGRVVGDRVRVRPHRRESAVVLDEGPGLADAPVDAPLRDEGEALADDVAAHLRDAELPLGERDRSLDDAAEVPVPGATGEELYRFGEADVATDCVRFTGRGVVVLR